VDYVFDRLDLDDESPEAAARREGWLRAALLTFRSARPDDEFLKRWRAAAREDGMVCAGAWLPEGAYGASAVPVATYASFDKPINVGREQLPARLVTMVTTSPTHLRRGLLRRLIEDDLSDAVAQGLPLAALTAADATIYGRWGFGVGTLRRSVEVAGGRRFALRDFTDPGRCELVDPRTAWETMREIYAPFQARTRGSVEWPTEYRDMHTGSYNYNDRGEDNKLVGAVHLDADEQPDGFVWFHYADEGEVKIQEMVALTPEAQLSMWRLLAGMDRVTKVTHGVADPLDPLPWALTDINACKVIGEQEFLWVRVLDVPRCLAARPWSADGTIVLEVEDAQGYAAGRWEVTVRDGVAATERTEADPHLRLTAETLATMLMGAAPTMVLHAAGRLAGSPDEAGRFATMADLPVPPYSITGF
jgi:predicted acetyltransferase